MTISVNTNQPALIVLQNLNRTNDMLGDTQNRINTGLKISTAKDNASVYAIAQKQRASIAALGAVTDSLNRATSISDVASAAGQTISDILNTMKQKVVAAMDPSQDNVSRAALNADQPNGPSVAIWTRSGRRAVQRRSNARLDGKPMRRWP